MVFKPARAILAALAGQGLTRNGSALDVTSVPVRMADGSTVYAKPAIVRVVGPASYTTGGFQVDCSAFFSSIVAAHFMRFYTTASGVSSSTGLAVPNESGSDTFANAKFLARHVRMGAHTHTYDKTNTPTGTPSGNPTGFGADNAHTHALTYTSTASGGLSSSSLGELSNGDNVSAFTYEFMVWGIPI